MDGWDKSHPIDLDWDARVQDYARLFQDGILDGSYTGVCRSDDILLALDMCADLVIRNLAPSSWFFWNEEKERAIYFHNTSSIGIYVPDLGELETVRELLLPIGLLYAEHW